MSQSKIIHYKTIQTAISCPRSQLSVVSGGSSYVAAIEAAAASTQPHSAALMGNGRFHRLEQFISPHSSRSPKQ